ncbi:Brl1/Brr6 domain-containing protein [Dimargaris cristalligena]|uniref:Brl1/Brr6 domain-containing protein n=1 Tax=Dimargaris cristalligena TaxID=215637 RepID=A0A4P9ZMM4_9FUNG|nr:Brl1/Brr6 domain-containing protein [Dimargaris cristalligena]|eukprot:RKP33550.1 Brl1/Brr6 domain-containing protein [Dimargaris cristalligena]
MIPGLFLAYAQLVFNVSIVVMLFYGISTIIQILEGDLQKQLDKQSHVLMRDIVKCSRDYFNNRCSHIDAPPALESTCDAWKTCMEQDDKNILKSKETAAILAEILTNFFGHLNDRTLMCFMAIFVTGVIAGNAILCTKYRL